MSKVKIQGNASGTGVLTVTAPNTSTDRTITLPDTTGTLLDENSSLPAANLTGTVADARISTLTASKLTGALPAISAANLTAIPAANITGTLPAISGANLTNIDGGKVLQVVYNNPQYQTNVDYGGGWADVPSLTISITPSATTSKIYYFFYASAHVHGSTDAGLKILRDSTQIKYSPRWGGFNSNGDWTPYALVVNGIDSPSTTSAITYKVQATRNGGSYFRVWDSAGAVNNGFCMAMEIGA